MIACKTAKLFAFFFKEPTQRGRIIASCSHRKMHGKTIITISQETVSFQVIETHTLVMYNNLGSV